mgnify:CR=1 FL=1
MPIRADASPVTYKTGSEPGTCFDTSDFSWPGPFPPRPPPPFITGLFERFNGTMNPSDSSPVPRQLRLLDFLSRPGIALATAGQMRSPRFRHVPFVRDEVFDPSRAFTPRITAHPYCLQPRRRSRPLHPALSRLNSSPHTIAVYASWPSSPTDSRNTHYQAGATPYLNRTFAGWNPPAFLAHRLRA